MLNGSRAGVTRGAREVGVNICRDPRTSGVAVVFVSDIVSWRQMVVRLEFFFLHLLLKNTLEDWESCLLGNLLVRIGDSFIFQARPDACQLLFHASGILQRI